MISCRLSTLMPLITELNSTARFRPKADIAATEPEMAINSNPLRFCKHGLLPIP